MKGQDREIMWTTWTVESEDLLSKFNLEWEILAEMILLEPYLEEGIKGQERNRSNLTMEAKAWKILLISDRLKSAMKFKMKILCTL